MLRNTLDEVKHKRGRGMKVASPADVLATIIATGLGSGLIPFAPGTFGSMLGVAVFYLFSLNPLLTLRPQTLQNFLIAAGVLTAFLGTWAANRAEKIFDRKDAGQIVIDEVCGQMLTFVFVPIHLSKQTPLICLIGFLLFRAFDILKPYPIRHLESLGSGLGVMADDILAGLYAAIVLSFVLPYLSLFLH
jgi:phosphatidylglycerophosphatase A